MEPIATSRLQTINIIILVVSAITLALGVALFANYLTYILGTTYLLFILAIFLIFISLFIITKIINPKVEILVKIKGGFHFEAKKLKGKEVIGYEFNNDMIQYLRAIATENKAYHNALLKENYNFNDNYDPNILNFHNLAASCAEFLFLDKLSLHLNSYFVDNNIDSSLIAPIPRNELSSDVLKNRILELITRSYEERAAFCDREIGENSKLCYAVGKDGEVYNSIELELPNNTKITRSKSNELIIENNIFEIIFKVECNGVSTVVASELLIGEYDALTLVAVELKITVKKKLFLDQDDLILHQWLDSFLIEFKDYMSIKELEKKSNLQLIKVLQSKYSSFSKN